MNRPAPSDSPNISGDAGVLRLAPAGDREDDVPRRAPSRPVPVDREDLPYKVEIWNETGASVEQIVAVTANAGIGYAAWHTDIGIRRAVQITRRRRSIPRRAFYCAEGRGRSRIPPTSDQYFGSRSNSSIETPSGPRIKQIRTPGRTVVGSRVNSTPFFFSSAATASMPLTVRPK